MENFLFAFSEAGVHVIFALIPVGGRTGDPSRSLPPTYRCTSISFLNGFEGGTRVVQDPPGDQPPCSRITCQGPAATSSKSAEETKTNMARRASTHLANFASRVVRPAVTLKQSLPVAGGSHETLLVAEEETPTGRQCVVPASHRTSPLHGEKWQAFLQELPPSFKRGIKYSKAVFSAADLDGDNEISVDELKMLLASMQCQLSSDQIELLARAADLNGDGRLQFGEFVELFEVRQ
eukprot:scaffold1401_cov330-Pavlova_lutheri.AAC.121